MKFKLKTMDVQNVILYAVLMMAVTACEMSLDLPPVREDVSVNIHAGGFTKSFWTGPEDTLCNLNIWAYRDGVLDAQCYRSGAGCQSSVSLRLFMGGDYRIYALANCGSLDAPYIEQSLDSYVVTVSSSRFSSGIPMSSDGPVNFVMDGTSVPDMSLVPLVARYRLEFNTPGTEGSETVECVVEDVTLHNVPGKLLPFSDDPLKYSAGTGDVATEADLYDLNNGEGAFFYTLAGPCSGDGCAYALVTAGYSYCDRPTGGSVTVRKEKLTYKLPVSSDGKVERGVSYSASLSPGPYAAGSGTVLQHSEQETFNAFVFVCNEKGIRIENMSFPASSASSLVKIYYRIYPDEPSAVKLSATGADAGLQLLSEAVPAEEEGVYYNLYSNDWQARKSSLSVNFRIAREDCSIEDGCTCLFVSNASVLDDYQGGGQQEIEY